MRLPLHPANVLLVQANSCSRVAVLLSTQAHTHTLTHYTRGSPDSRHYWHRCTRIGWQQEGRKPKACGCARLSNFHVDTRTAAARLDDDDDRCCNHSMMLTMAMAMGGGGGDEDDDDDDVHD